MEIRELRLLTGFSQNKFVSYFEIPVKTLQDWERRRKSVERAMAIVLSATQGSEEMFMDAMENIVIQKWMYSRSYWKD